MAASYVDMEESGDEMEPEQKDMEHTVEFFLEAFQAEIRKLLSAADVKKLISMYKFDFEGKKRLGEYADNKVSAEVFDEILKSIRNMKDKPLKYTALANAFKEMGHEKAHLILTGVAMPTNTTHKELISKCWDDICTNLNIQHILPYLLMHDLVSEEERQIIQREDEHSGNWMACYQLLICLSNKRVDWYPKFMATLLKSHHADLASKINQELRQMHEDGADTTMSMTLNSPPIAVVRPSTSSVGYSSTIENIMSGHEKAHLILTGVAMPTNTTHKELISKCCDDICTNLNIQHILPYLLMHDLVSEEERQIIQRTDEQSGNWMACYRLLICLSNKRVDWYPTFMTTLLESQHEDLASKINQELRQMHEDGADTTMSMTLNSPPIAVVRPSTSSVGYSSTIENIMSVQEDPEPMNNLDAPPPVPKQFDSFQEVESMDKESVDEIFLMKPTNLKDFNFKPERTKSVSVDEEERTVKESVEDYNFQEMVIQSINEVKESNQIESNITPEPFSSASTKASDRETTPIPSRTEETKAENIFEDDSSEEDNEDFNSPPPDTTKLVLKEFQLELAENATAGINTVICAGTGTGKTFVALHIVEKHLSQKLPKGVRKVVFMARTSALIKQQADRCKRYLPEFQTKLLTGENEDSRNIGMFLADYDILCMTPKILENSLDSGSVKSLTELSLLILDECHHTIKDEPYNALMRKYLLEKYANKRKDLPQVIGLTASVGVGKSSSDEDALDYMLHLFANLDVRVLSVVKRNIALYEREISHPSEELITMTVPYHDPCKDILMEAIEETEDKLQGIALMIPSMIEMMTEKCPPNKQSQEYQKWTVDLEKMAMQNVAHDETARNIRTCAIYLNVYNAALEVNNLLGPIDVITFLAKKHESDHLNQKKLTDEEKKLLTDLQGVQKKLRKYHGKKNENVERLCHILKGMMSKNVEESRAMVFVKARATCLALEAFIKKYFKDLGIDVHCLYGKENRGGLDGMTESVQNETVEKFRKGDYKVLVATSVGIEGIDVPDCNIVLSYNYQGNEITKIQMKGRSRKKDGHNVIIGDEKVVEREKINAFKEAMMIRAQKRFLQLDSSIIERKVSLYQCEEMNKYRMRMETEKIKKSRKNIEEEFEILCRRCATHACYTSDIRMVKCQYIVITESFKDRVKLEPHKRPKMYDGFDKKWKMYCKKCPMDWGIVSENKGLLCRTLKLISLKFRNLQTGIISPFTKWEDVPTVIPEIQVEDLIMILAEIERG